MHFDYESPHLDADLDYIYTWFLYTDLDTDSSYHNFGGSVTGKALEEALQVEVGAERRQVLSNPLDVIPPSQLPLSGNLVDRDLYYVNPSYVHKFRNATIVDMNYVYEDFSYDDPTVQGNVNHDARISVDNFARGQGLTWALRYLWQETVYEISLPWKYQQASAELGFWATRRARLFARAGKESPWDDPFDYSLKYSFWEAGFAYGVRDRLRAEFAIGEREFGSSWRGEFDYTFDWGNTVFSYSEKPTTRGFRGQNRRIPSDDPSDLDDYLDRPGSAESFIANRLLWQLNLNFRRTKVSLNVFDELREDRIRPDGSPLPDQAQLGARALVSWNPGPRSEVRLTGRFVNRESESGEESDFLQATFRLGYDLSRRTTLSLAYSYSEQTPVSGEATREYTANVVSLFLTISI